MGRNACLRLSSTSMQRRCSADLAAPTASIRMLLCHDLNSLYAEHLMRWPVNRTTRNT